MKGSLCPAASAAAASSGATSPRPFRQPPAKPPAPSWLPAAARGMRCTLPRAETPPAHRPAPPRPTAPAPPSPPTHLAAGVAVPAQLHALPPHQPVQADEHDIQPFKPRIRRARRLGRRRRPRHELLKHCGADSGGRGSVLTSAAMPGGAKEPLPAGQHFPTNLHGTQAAPARQQPRHATGASVPPERQQPCVRRVLAPRVPSKRHTLLDRVTPNPNNRPHRQLRPGSPHLCPCACWATPWARWWRSAATCAASPGWARPPLPPRPPPLLGPLLLQQEQPQQALPAAALGERGTRL